MSLICTEVFLWLTHQNLDYPEIFWCNVRNWGGIAPIAPPGYVPGSFKHFYYLLRSNCAKIMLFLGKGSTWFVSQRNGWEICGTPLQGTEPWVSERPKKFRKIFFILKAQKKLVREQRGTNPHSWVKIDTNSSGVHTNLSALYRRLTLCEVNEKKQLNLGYSVKTIFHTCVFLNVLWRYSFLFHYTKVGKHYTSKEDPYFFHSRTINVGVLPVLAIPIIFSVTP